MPKLPSKSLIRQLAPMTFLSISASLALFGIVGAMERSQAEERFREVARQHLIAIRTNISIAESSVDLLVRHFAISTVDATSRKDFAHLVAPTIGKYKFIQAFSWNPLVRYSDRKAYEDLARSDGLENFQIWERDAGGKAIRAVDRSDYVPIYYIEPMATNAPALGFDLSSNPVRKAALDSGHVERRMRATGRITLVQDKQEQFGVLLLAPVYDRLAKETLTGYVRGVFRITDLVEGSTAAAGLAPGQIDIALFDIGADEGTRQLFPRHSAPTPEVLLERESVSEAFEVGGRTWLLVATPNLAFADAYRPFASYSILAVTLAASILYLRTLGGRMAQATEATKLAHELEASQLRLDQSQKIARLAYLEVDSAERIIKLGPDAIKLLGLESTPLGKSFSLFLADVHPDDRDELETALLSTRGFNLEFRIGAVTLHAQAKAADEDGTTLVIIQDVTRRKSVEEERAQMIARMAEADRLQALGTMAGGIAHEINTPMQYVGDNIAFMRDGMQSLLDLGRLAQEALAGESNFADIEKVAGSLDLDFLMSELPLAAEQALDGTARIAKIVQAIKEFSYPSSKMPQAIDVNHLVDVVATVTKNQWKYVANVQFDLTPDLPPIHAVEGEINQVLVNLVVNAAQAIEEQKRPDLGRIDIVTRHLGEQVELIVADDGPGIPPETLKQVFELFFTTKPPGKGTGQGLAIARSIILRHQGEITVTSPPAGGTRFCIRLPVKASEIPSDHSAVLDGVLS